jgi:hypothetical protein
VDVPNAARHDAVVRQAIDAEIYDGRSGAGECPRAGHGPLQAWGTGTIHSKTVRWKIAPALAARNSVVLPTGLALRLAGNATPPGFSKGTERWCRD